MASLVPLPAMAAEEGSAPKPGVITAAVSTIAVADAPAARATAARAARQSTPQRDASFFRSKPGILAVAVMAIGVGYALYSAREDRIKSPGKE